MRTKRLVAGILAMATITASMAGAMVATAATDTVAASISTAEAKAGDTFKLSVDLKDIPGTGISGVDFGIQYDSDLVTVTKVETSTLADTGAAAAEGNIADPFEVNIESGMISTIWAVGLDNSDYYMKGSGEFLTITGTVNSDAKAGSQADFKIVPVDRALTSTDSTLNSKIYFGYLNGTTAVEYAYTLTDGYVKVIGDSTEDTTSGTTGGGVAATKYGDVNNDGSIDLADLVLLSQYVADPTGVKISDVAKANANVYKDGSINNSDVMQLLKYISGQITADALGADL